MRTATYFVFVFILTVSLALTAFAESKPGGKDASAAEPGIVEVNGSKSGVVQVNATDYCRTDLNKAIPDNNPDGVNDTITISGITPGDVVQSIAVRLDAVLHTWVGDLTMTLSHNGATSTLMHRPGPGTLGSSGNNFTGTVLVDSATLRIDSIAAAGAPYTGIFRPDSGGAPNIVPSSLNQFVGTDPNGDWVLFIRDSEAADLGTLQAWCLLLETGPSTGVDPIGTPGAFKLEQNYPNPFNPTTSIQFTLPVSANVTLKILNIMGQEIATLVDGHQDAGTFNAIWNGNSKEGYTVASGLYFYQLTAVGSSSSDVFRSMKRMLLLK